LENGLTQIAKKGQNQVFAWNHPTEVVFESSKVQGWPQMVLSIYNMNKFGQDEVCGYCWVHSPLQPGR
jgi:hypothetical protein